MTRYHLLRARRIAGSAAAALARRWVRSVVLVGAVAASCQAGCGDDTADDVESSSGGTGAAHTGGGGSAGVGGSMQGGAGTDRPGGAGGSEDGTSGVGPSGGSSTTGGNGGTTAGQSGAGGSSDGGSGDGGDDGTAVLGDPCDTPGALACAGFHQRVTLICDREWTVNQTCGGDQVCDTSSGINRGICRDRLPECRDFEPGHRFCQSDTTLVACGPDNVTLEVVETCTGICWGDTCDNRPNHCPSPSLGAGLINCADDCGGRTERWCEENCPSLSLPLLPNDTIVIRSPAYGGACVPACNPTRRGILIAQDVPNAPLPAVRVSVAPPWYVTIVTVQEDFCTTTPESCLVYAGGYGSLYVYTDDPAAGPANVSVETSSQASGLSCPP
jgi:hypothetical protein